MLVVLHSPETLTCEDSSPTWDVVSTNWQVQTEKLHFQYRGAARSFEKCILLKHTLTFDLFTKSRYHLLSEEPRYLEFESAAVLLSYSVVYNCSWWPDLLIFIFPIADPKYGEQLLPFVVVLTVSS